MDGDHSNSLNINVTSSQHFAKQVVARKLLIIEPDFREVNITRCAHVSVRQMVGKLFKRLQQDPTFPFFSKMLTMLQPASAYNYHLLQQYIQ